MCGIIGIIGKKDVAADLIEGLKRLEYRGYDSAGIATVADDHIDRRRAEGKIVQLESVFAEKPLAGALGIGHTRWATHGVPNTQNAHPHATDKVAVVHNGIIENFAELRNELQDAGYAFATETDTEVIPQLITYFLDNASKPYDAVAKAVKRLKGAYAIGVIFADNDNLMIAARHGSPLAIGYGKNEREGEVYIGSDAIALAGWTSDITYLEEGDIAQITRNSITINDLNNLVVERSVIRSSISSIALGKENYRHFMLKEIFEQPSVIGDVLHAYTQPLTGTVQLPKFPFELEEIERLTIVACGTSYYAGLVARYWFEQIAGIPVHIDIASEFRYRETILSSCEAAVFISQSGETADTLAALRYTKSQKTPTIAVVNVMESTMAREADVVLPTYSGPEIGVASTKAFTTQLVTLALLVLSVAQARKKITESEIKAYLHALSEIPSRMAEVLAQENAYQELSHELALAKSILYIGRGTAYGIALEGALKLKEVSYIHAEAAAAGELKHGPIALVDENVPVVAIAPHDTLFDKTASNIREVATRGGKVILISNRKGIKALGDVTYHNICLPETTSFVTPVLYALPIQLLAYYVAVTKGTDVDQPRNLAKSVTVE